MANPIFTGACVALVTPMNDDYSINFERIDDIVEQQIAGGTDAICVCGTTGEASTLNAEEHDAVIKRVVDAVHKRIPVIAGTGSNDTNYGIMTSLHAQELGADALLMVTPYYNKASQLGLIKHYTKLADSVKLPIILYNVPSRTSTNLLPETIKELSKHPNIVAVKEASDNVSQITKVASLCGDDVTIYSGSDDLIVPVISIGGKGVISVLSNIVPKVAHDIAALSIEGKYDESRKLALEYYDLCKALFCDVNPIPVKTAMNLMGMDVGPCRLPLCEMSEGPLQQLKASLVRHGLIQG